MEFTETDPFRRVPSPKDQSSQALKGYTSAIRLSILNCRTISMQDLCRTEASGNRIGSGLVCARPGLRFQGFFLRTITRTMR